LLRVVFLVVILFFFFWFQLKRGKKINIKIYFRCFGHTEEERERERWAESYLRFSFFLFNFFFNSHVVYEKYKILDRTRREKFFLGFVVNEGGWGPRVTWGKRGDETSVPLPRFCFVFFRMC